MCHGRGAFEHITTDSLKLRMEKIAETLTKHPLRIMKLEPPQHTKNIFQGQITILI